MIRGIAKSAKSGSVVRRWFISYFFLLLIPLVVSLGMYFKIETVVERELERSNNLLLLQVQKELDNVFDAQSRLCVELAFDEDIGEAIEGNGDEEQLKQKIFNKLRAMRLSNEQKVDDLFVYLYDMDTVVTSNAVFDGKTFYYLYYTAEYQSYDEWKELFWENISEDYTAFEAERTVYSGNTIVFSKTIPISTWDIKPKAMVGTIFGTEKIRDIADELERAGGSELVVWNNKNRILFKSFDDEETDYESYGEDDGLLVDSGIKGWKYFISKANNGDYDQVLFLRVLISVYVVFTLVFGTFFGKKFIKQNYAPIAELMGVLKKKRSGDEEYDEFEIIFNEVTKILSERDNVSDELKDTKESLRKSFLAGVLTGKFKNENEVNEMGGHLGVNFSSKKFAVALFDIEDYESLFENEENLSAEQRYRYYQLIIVNIMEELLREKYECYVFEIDGMMAALVGFSEETAESTVDGICESIAFGIGMVEKHFGVLTSASVSDIHNDFCNIDECYYEAYEVICGMKANGQSGVAKYADLIKPTHSDLRVRTEQEIYLINFIQTGDKEKACGIIKECFEHLAGESRYKTELLRCNMFNLLNVIYNAAEDRINARTDFSKEEYLERLFRCGSIEMMEDLMCGVCETVCGFDDGEEEKNVELVEKVKRLVEESYDKHGFGVMEIGEHFGLTPSYVSRVFKNGTNELLMEYISHKRIERAKQLMRETNYTIEAISTKVGYLNSKIFSRAFKKTEGILPSQYKAVIKRGK